MKKMFFAIIFIFSITFLANAQSSYFVSSSGGNNNNSGKSSSSPWKTLSKLNSISFKPGDKIYFKKGDKWREQLNVASLGSSSSKIEFNSYGTGAKPIISGAQFLSGFALHSGSIWKKSLTTKPQQVFFNNLRGKEKTSVSALTSARDWYYNATAKMIYVYSSGNPSTSYISPGIEASIRNYGIYVTGKNIHITNLQIEKTARHGIFLTSTTDGIIVNGISFLQWTNAEVTSRAGIFMQGRNNIVKNSTFGKHTGNHSADQSWAGYVSILVDGANMIVENNKIYHSSTEAENTAGGFAYGIRINSTSGILKIFKNFIYHTGSHGISVRAHTKSGDQIHIYENTIEHPGQAGLSLYQTRSSDGIGGKGYIYKNDISYANRLGGYFGPNQASGIHFNDGVRSGTEVNKPYMKWYCYENIVHDNKSVKLPNSQDASGISMDFNAKNVEVYQNLVYNNNGKGIYMWNANNCKIYYNIVYGNDCGMLIAAEDGGIESAQNNQVYNNTFYKNYNGDARGPNVNAEIYFGQNSKNNTFKNNIIYSASSGFAYIFNVKSSTSQIVDYNIIYSERGAEIASDGSNGRETFSRWKINHPTWDRNSKNTNPQLNNPSGEDFSLKTTSAAINAGTLLGLTTDFLGKTLISTPDIGALEFGSSIPSGSTGNTVIILNALNGKLSGDARLGHKYGAKNSKTVYFLGTSGGLSFNVNIPKTGNWYAWARMYYMRSGSANSFFIKVNSGTKHILGTSKDRYDKWYWDGFDDEKINLGTLNSGSNTILISGREPGTTLWVDQIVLTDNPNYDPNNALSKNVNEEENIGTENDVLPTDFDISQNYPNPFNPATTIKYAVPENSHVSIKVFDILGAEVAQLVNEVMSPGYYEVKFDGSSLASGIYIYQIRTDKIVLSKKMNLLK